MTIDWKKEVASRKDDLLKDLFTLLSIPSVREDDKATADAPVGPGPKEALLKFLEIGERDGFTTKNVENIAGHIEYGEGDETLGIFGHVDVVPVGEGWESDPFKPEIRDGKIYARGSSDDKGPSMAAYYAVKMIKELNLPVSKRIRFILGTDEESGWACMDRYLAVEETPDFGFSPDAEFPIINGEKGMTNLRVSFKSQQNGAYTLKDFAAGQRPNMVPESAKAVVVAPSEAEAQKMVTDYQMFLETAAITGEATVAGNEVTFFAKGKAAHAQEPRGGVNAGTFLAVFLNEYDFAGGAAKFIQTIAEILHEDSRGVKLTIQHTDVVMGDLTVNPGILQFNAETAEIVLNIRYPKGITLEELVERSQKVLGEEVDITIDLHGHTPHYVPGDDPLVQTLLQVYEDHTGLKGAEKVIGGGTFGRLLKRGVAYGAMFPHSVDTMHQANEFMALDDLLNATAIYADAIYRLVK